jgi:type I restriction enzyme, S subunit
MATVCVGGTPSRKRDDLWNGDIPWVSSGEVENCRIKTTHECITLAGLSGSNAKLYPAGTVLIAMIGEGKTRGQSAILDIEAATNQNVAALVFDTDDIVPEYVWFWALCQYESTRDEGRGGNQPALNGAKVSALNFPMCPKCEQCEIVRRVEALMKLADAIEHRVALASARTDKTTQAILAKAFRGELVPTEADLARAQGRDYESADQLLTRIQSANYPAPRGQRSAIGRVKRRSKR